MKTYKHSFEKVCDFGNLLRAYKQAAKCKRYRPYALEFTYALEDNLLKLQDELVNQTYHHGQYHQFYVYDPKKRKISAAPFRDRVVHHALCNVIEPIFERTFIYDSYACRVGKGTHAGVDRLTTFLRERAGLYVLKCDISRYFENIDHKILLELIMHKLRDKSALWLIEEIIRSNNSDCGIPIGNLTSQLFANIYLSRLDHFVKVDLRIKRYIRYVDDFVILEKSKKTLHVAKQRIGEFLKERLKLTLHPKKQLVFPAHLGVDFLGYRVWPTHRLLRKSSIRRMKQRLKKYQRLYQEGAFSFNEIQQSIASWLGHAAHADTYNLRRKLFSETMTSLCASLLKPATKLEVSGDVKLSGRIRQGSLGDLSEMMTLASCILNPANVPLDAPEVLAKGPINRQTTLALPINRQTMSLPINRQTTPNVTLKGKEEYDRYLKERPEAGDVVIIDEQDGGVRRSFAPFASNTAGIISTNPAQILRDGLKNAVPVALNGIVPCKVSSENGAIKPGDLLVSSSLPGHAMRAGKNPPVGTVVGKALARLEEDKEVGVVEVLVMMK